MNKYEDLFRHQNAIDSENKLFQELQQEKNIEPLEADPYIPYTDTEAFKSEILKIDQMSQSLQEIRNIQNEERQARLNAEKAIAKDTLQQRQIERIRFWITFIVTLIGSLAAVGGLIATIVLN